MSHSAKKVAIMQPYFFPYIGYFQLLGAVDEFVFLEDVDYIKQGWINRNRLIISERTAYFSVPIRDQSSNIEILNTFIDERKFPQWKKKLFKSIRQYYSTSPFFDIVFEMIRQVLEAKHQTISSLAVASIEATKDLIGISTVIKSSSHDYNLVNANGVTRLIDICKEANAHIYVNLPGGRELYKQHDFSRRGVELQFIKSQTSFTPQETELSILHLLFGYGPIRVSDSLRECECLSE